MTATNLDQLLVQGLHSVGLGVDAGQHGQVAGDLHVIFPLIHCEIDHPSVIGGLGHWAVLEGFSWVVVLNPCEENGGCEDANTWLYIISSYPVHEKAMHIDMEVDLMLSASFC